MSSLFGIGANGAANFYNGVATQSLRFNDDDSAYLSRTPSSASNRKTFTFSAWVKGADAALQTLFSGGTGSGDDTLNFRIDDGLMSVNNGTAVYRKTTQFFRDFSAWYHVVLAVDTTQSTDTNRIKFYVNGTLITAFAGIGTIPSQNTDVGVNQDELHTIGRRANSADRYLNGYMAEVNFVDGTQYDASYFGETKNGVWIAKTPNVTYGTNGFRLQFKQTGTGTASSSTIGADTSGNNNHFTSNNLSAHDCVPDSPENNWSTMNSLINGYGTNITMSEGNLAGTGTSGQYNNTLGTILMTSGKWYWEITSANFNNYDMLGIAIETAIQTTDSTPYGQTGVIAYATQGAVYNESASGTGSYTSFQNSEIIGIAVDLDASPRTFKFYNNNTLQGTINLSSNFDNVGILPFFCIGNTDTIKVNFGQDSSFAGLKTAQGNTDENDIGDFYYAPPSSFLSLCAFNLPEPTIGPNSLTQADDYFNTVLYTGSGSTQSITGVGFQSDWSWFKRRDASVNHVLYDSTRGGTNALRSNTSGAESQFGDAVVTFQSDGFQIAGTNVSGINGSSHSMVAWNWKANGGTTSSNSDGSVTSTVQANTTAGFSIVTFTTSASSNTTFTVGHSLGSVPKMIIAKQRDASSGWSVYHHKVDSSAPHGYYILLNDNGARVSSSLAWGNTAPTSTVFSTYTSGFWGQSNEIVAYCFTEIEGYSKMGSYTGNGNADGAFVFTGFRPAWLLIKKTSGSQDWQLMDTTRDSINLASRRLESNNSDAEVNDTSYNNMDIVSNGFKFRADGGNTNDNGGTYIYMAFAEAPFKYANAR